MTQSGAPAALRGYRLQALYTLKRIFAPGLDEMQVFQPEGMEDLDIRDLDGTIAEAIQVKSYAGLVLSDLEPDKETSFLHRAVGLLGEEHPPVIKLVNFGSIGPELDGAWKGEHTYRERVAVKLRDKGFKQPEIEKLFDYIEMVSLDEDNEREALITQIRNLSTGIDPVNALDLCIAWYHRLAERRQGLSCAEIIAKVNAVGRFLAERYHYHAQWHANVEPLETVPISEVLLLRLRDEFYAGVGARYEHILADLDFPREHKTTEILQKFEESKIVIVHAASGQGKSTLAYRYLHDRYPNKWRFAVKRVQDVDHALQIAVALSGFAKAVEVPIAVYLDVRPRDTEWIELLRQLANQPFLEVLVTIREEDYRRANILGAGLDFAEVGLDFDRTEAEFLYERARSTSEQWGFLDFDAAWDAFGSKGPLMEFVYLLTQTETLQQRLESQVQRIEEEVRTLKASPDELRLLSLVAVASAHGARLRTRDVIEALDLPSPNRTLERFEQEYLLRRTSGGMCLEGLHSIRSTILSRLLIQPDLNPWLGIAAQALPRLLEEDLETFILNSLVDKHHGLDCDGLLDLVMTLEPKTWSGIVGVLRALLWAGAQDYVAENRTVLDAAYEEMGPAWWFVVDLNFALPGESQELGEWWTTLGSLIPPERQTRIKDIQESQTPKNELFQRCREWLCSLSTPPSPPSAPETWQDVAEAWYWAARLVPGNSFVNWVPEEEFDTLVVNLPLTILADFSLSLHQCALERHQEWLEVNEDVLHQRLAHEENILTLEELDATLKIHFMPSGDVVGDSSDPLHDETMTKIGLMRRLYPGYERYGAQGYGFKPAGMDLPQGDSTQKAGVPATYLPPKWLTWLNGAVGGIARLRYRPDSWADYLDMVIEARRLIATCLDGMDRGLVRFYQRDKPINVGLDYVDLQAWQRCREQLSGVFDLPRTAVDPWGFASESAAGSYLQTLAQQQYVPAIALQKYKPYLKSQRDYFSSIRTFFEQAPAVWETNAHAGKLHRNDPQKRTILEALQRQGVKTDPSLSVDNLFESKTQLPEYQGRFKALFAHYLGQDKIAALEKHETEVLTVTWPLWYYYAYEPWRAASNPRRQVPQWMDIARYQLSSGIQESLESIQRPECTAALLDYNREWHSSPALWARLDLDDPTHLYASILEAIPTALREALGHAHLSDFNHYLVKETCQYLVIVPVIRGRMLDDLIWPMHTLTILQAEDLQEKPWAYFSQESADVVREDLRLEKWDAPGIRTANQLSRSVATLRQLTSQVSEFQEMPDPTEPGMEKVQTYLLEEVSEMLSTSLQTFFDAGAELLDQFNVLSTSEQQHRDKLRTAVKSLIEASEYVHPAEGDGSFKLDLAETVEYAQRLEEVYLVVEGIRLSWITDILDQLD